MVREEGEDALADWVLVRKSMSNVQMKALDMAEVSGPSDSLLGECLAEPSLFDTGPFLGGEKGESLGDISAVSLYHLVSELNVFLQESLHLADPASCFQMSNLASEKGASEPKDRREWYPID